MLKASLPLMLKVKGIEAEMRNPRAEEFRCNGSSYEYCYSIHIHTEKRDRFKIYNKEKKLGQ